MVIGLASFGAALVAAALLIAFAGASAMTVAIISISAAVILGIAGRLAVTGGAEADAHRCGGEKDA
jgi:hypothetical protein